MSWFEHWFNSPYYTILYRHRDAGEAGRFIRNLVAYLKPDKEAHFLDLACGSGRHALFLNRLGYRVSGADISENSIALAQKYSNDRLQFKVHDMRSPFCNGCVDYVLNLFTSFGYFDDDEDELKTLRAVHNALKTQGHFVIDFLNVHKVLAELVAEEEKEIDGIVFKINRYVAGNQLHKEIEVAHNGMKKHYREQVKLLHEAHFRKLFTDAGFEIENIFGSYELEEYNKSQSDRLILSAIKA